MAVREKHGFAPHTLTHGAQPLQRAPRAQGAQVGPELDANASQVLEDVLPQEQSGFGVDDCSAISCGLPAAADFDSRFGAAAFVKRVAPTFLARPRWKTTNGFHRCRGPGA